MICSHAHVTPHSIDIRSVLAGKGDDQGLEQITMKPMVVLYPLGHVPGHGPWRGRIGGKRMLDEEGGR